MKRMGFAMLTILLLVTLVLAGRNHLAGDVGGQPKAGAPWRQALGNQPGPGAGQREKADADRQALVEAAAAGDTSRVKALIAGGADVNAKNRFGSAPLVSALVSGHADTAEALINTGADVNVDGGAPLATAMQKGRQEVVALLLAKGANVNARREDGLTPLMLVAGAGDFRNVTLLLERGADVPGSGRTPLHYAASYSDSADIVRALLDKGADVSARDAYGETALMMAAREGHLAAVQALLAGGADPNVQSTGNGNTALMAAAASGRDDIVQVLLAAGADVNARQAASKYTPLMFAASEGHAEVTQSLVNSGADVNAKSANGETALTLAERGNKTAAARILSRSSNR